MYSQWFEWYFDGTLPELQRGEEVIVNRLLPSGPKIHVFIKKIRDFGKKVDFIP